MKLDVSNTQAISIHALTWRVTLQGFSPSAPAIDFNPRPHVEGD